MRAYVTVLIWFCFSIHAYADVSTKTDIENVIKVGYDLKGKHAVQSAKNTPLFTYPKEKNNIAAGESISWDSYFYGVSQNIGLGVGAAYHGAREIDGGVGSISFIPIYSTVKIRLNNVVGVLGAYMIGQLGHSMVSSSLKYVGQNNSVSGGVYTGFGGGLSIKRVQVELISVVNRANRTNTGYATQGQFIGGNYVLLPVYYSTSRKIRCSNLTLSLGVKF